MKATLENMKENYTVLSKGIDALHIGFFEGVVTQDVANLLQFLKGLKKALHDQIEQAEAKGAE